MVEIREEDNKEIKRAMDVFDESEKIIITHCDRVTSVELDVNKGYYPSNDEISNK